MIKIKTSPIVSKAASERKSLTVVGKLKVIELGSKSISQRKIESEFNISKCQVQQILKKKIAFKRVNSGALNLRVPEFTEFNWQSLAPSGIWLSEDYHFAGRGQMRRISLSFCSFVQKPMSIFSSRWKREWHSRVPTRRTKFLSSSATQFFVVCARISILTPLSLGSLWMEHISKVLSKNLYVFITSQKILMSEKISWGCMR